MASHENEPPPDGNEAEQVKEPFRYRWQVPNSNPSAADSHQLKILNSFTKSKEPFVPIQPKLIKWYSCGPTVYDESHLGHARCYITFDIIRRVLTNYFGFHVFYVMNITDIDDKIIKRATSNHFGDNPNLDEVLDHQIFKELTTKFEQDFHDDMNKLEVMPPNALTRVTEYVDEIGQYIKRIEENGYAYRAGGSVYFDTRKFDSEPKHAYAKLVREAYGQSKRLDEGEGVLTALQPEKRSPNDFALWKKSKPGEPSWKTQDYERGRPGWHIECSVMASHLLGECFDIHSGGCDLKFPHHDNEIAQAEAYYDTGENWVNYFVHSGHLSIEGCKMSKSLKNFITIKKALQEYTARQLRFAFLCHSWAETLDYSPNTMNSAISYEKVFSEFFLNVADTIRNHSKSIASAQEDRLSYSKWSSEDQKMNSEFMNTVQNVDIALCNNFDTRSVLTTLQALIKDCNKSQRIDVVLLKDIARYIWQLMSVFGVNFDEVPLSTLSLVESKQKEDNQSGIKYVEALAEFRANVRGVAKSGLTSISPEQAVKQILALCDVLRDQTLPDLGVRLEDKQVQSSGESGQINSSSSYVVKVVGVEAIAQERALALKMKEEKQKQKAQKQSTGKTQKAQKIKKPDARSEQGS